MHIFGVAASSAFYIELTIVPISKGTISMFILFFFDVVVSSV